MDYNQDGVIVMAGLAGDRPALADKVSRCNIDCGNFDLSIAAVLYVFEQRNLGHDETDQRDGKRRHAKKD